jgi:hypothetical protein
VRHRFEVPAAAKQHLRASQRKDRRFEFCIKRKVAPALERREPRGVEQIIKGEHEERFKLLTPTAANDDVEGRIPIALRTVML